MCVVKSAKSAGVSETKAKGKETTKSGTSGQSSSLHEGEVKVKTSTSGKSSGQEPKKRRSMNIGNDEIEKESEKESAVKEARLERLGDGG